MKHRVVALLLIMVVLVNVSGVANALELPVPRFSQTPYKNLCWATAASMVIAYGKPDSIDRKVDIAKMIHDPNKLGLPFDKGGTPQNIRDVVWTYLRWAGSIWNSMLTYTGVQHQTNNGGPVVAGMKKTYSDGQVVLHALTIRGHERIGTEDRVIYNDPIDGARYSIKYRTLVTHPTWGAWVYSVFWK